MFKKLLVRFIVASVLAVIVVSYFEKPLVSFFMPFRELIMVPQMKVGNENKEKINTILPYKASKDGYYINPWEASSVVNNIADNILLNSCQNITKEDKEKLTIFADYFVNSTKIRNIKSIDFAVWEFPINYTYGVTPGWISGMAQARVAKVLYASSMCDFKTEAVNSYKKFYELTINSFEVVVKNGGVQVEVQGGLWYEEYAQENINPPLVLNGHIYATLDLYQLGQFDSRAKMLASKGLAAVKENIQHYDAITWSYYDRVKTPANNVYQQPLHTRQMKEIYALTGDEIYMDYHKKFQYQLYSPFSSIQRFYLNQTNFLGFLLFVNTVFFLILIIGGEFIYRKVKNAN